MGLKKLAKGITKGIISTVKTVTNPITNLAENTVKTGVKAVEDTGKLAERTVSNVRDIAGDVGTDVYHGVGDLAENTAKEIDRNKHTIAGTLLAPVTGGASLALASKDDTTLGEATQKGLSEVGDAVNWNENRGMYIGSLAGALTGGFGGLALGSVLGKQIIDDPAKADYEKNEKRRAEAQANAALREANTMSKRSMLANELSMTARRAMSKRAQANLRKNTSTPASQFLGGEQQTLG